jgi:O-antigen ligase
MLAYAGIQIFLGHPLLGVGWQASGTSPVIGASALNALLMATFPGMPEEYFFLTRPLSPHNMYIQFLAELGIVGTIAFVYAAAAIAKTIRRILREARGGAETGPARFYAFGLLFLLLWWNGHSLYGGQIESALACVFLGGLAAERHLARTGARIGVERVHPSGVGARSRA